MQSEKAVSPRNLDATPSKESPKAPSKPQAKLPSPQAGLRFQLAPKNLTADPNQN